MMQQYNIAKGLVLPIWHKNNTANTITLDQY